MKNELTFLGHASMKLITSQGVVIYLDPAFSCDGYQEAADIILVTHHHGDHDKVKLVKQKEDCLILDNKVMLVAGEYQSKTVKDIQITAVPAYNKNHKKNESVGYLLFIDELVIYFAGDTSKTSEMVDLKKYNVDYAIMPVDGYYNMGPEEALECWQLIGAKYFIPIHNDPRSMDDGKEYPTNFDKLSGENIIIINHGGTVEL